MAFTYDTKAQFSGTGNPLTTSYTCGADVNLLVLAIAVDGRTNARVGVPTYNGVEMSSLTNRVSHSSGEMNMELWYLKNPTTGSAQTISIPNANGRSLFCHAYSFKTASGKIPEVDSIKTATLTGANPSASITTTADDDLIISTVGNDVNLWAPTAQTGTQLYDTDHGAWGTGHQYILTNTAGSNTLSWTQSNATDSAIIMVAFKETTDSGQLIIDNITNGNEIDSAANPWSWNHTCNGTNRVLIVAIESANRHPTGVTYNSVSMTQVQAVNDGGYSSLWSLINPATGTNAVSVAFATSTYGKGSSISFINADQTTQPDASTNETGSVSNTNTISLTTNTANAILVDSFAITAAIDSNSLAPHASQGQMVTIDGAFVDAGASFKQGGAAGSHDMIWNWTYFVSAAFAHTVLAVKPAAVSGGEPEETNSLLFGTNF